MRTGPALPPAENALKSGEFRIEWVLAQDLIRVGDELALYTTGTRTRRMRTERKLATILAADVVGYSELMAADEEGTVARLKALREIVDATIASHQGRIFHTAGDSVVAEFASAVEAVRCAVDIQQVLQQRNTEQPDAEHMQLRIGVNLGDVLVDGDNLLGDGVNVAARLEALADAGSVYISGSVHEQVRYKVAFGFADLGDQTVKNIPDPVRVYRVQPRGEPGRVERPAVSRFRTWSLLPKLAMVVAAGLLLLCIALWATWPRPLGLLIDIAGVSGPPVDPALPDAPSIVVLPFDNMSGDSEQEYFSDGLSEDLTTELARHPYLFVIARNSAFVYKGQRVNVQDVGRELGVRYVLEGSVRKAGGRVRVTAQLIDATTGGHVWSESYDRDLSDIFAIQSEISEQILVAVQGKIKGAEFRRVERKLPRDFTWNDALWRGIYHSNRETREDNATARQLFERAIELDPHLSQPYALIGNTYLIELLNGWSTDATLLDKAEGLGRRAVELDVWSADGHLTLALVNITRGRLDAAILNTESALEIEPNFATAHAFHGLALAQQGRFLEATRSIKQALRLDPLPADFLLMITAYVNAGAGRRAEAVELMERVRQASPDNVIARVALAGFYEQAGRHAEAAAVVQEMLRITPDLTTTRAVQLIPGWEMALGAEEFARYPDYLRTAGLP
jgi:adenylate cyclase